MEVIESWSECYVKRIANFREVVEDEMDRYMSVFNNEGYLIKESKAKRLFRKKPPVVDIDSLSPEEQSKLLREGLIEYLAALANSLDISDDIMNDKFAPTYKRRCTPTTMHGLVRRLMLRRRVLTR